MKFRKVCPESDDAAVANGWTVATASSSAAYPAVRAMNHRRLPLNQNNERRNIAGLEGETANTQSDNPFENFHSELSIENEQEILKQQSLITPKAEIEYKIEERRPPPKDVIEHFYNLAMEQNEELERENEFYAQRELLPARLLSLEDVLLPAVAHQENVALKQIQRKIQRDAPDQIYVVQAGRVAVVECLGAALMGVQQSRLARHGLEQQREERWAHERQALRAAQRQKRKKEQESRRTENAELKEVQNEKEKKERKKKLSLNQDLWREVAFLMTESSKLAKQERLWKEAEDILTIREEEVKAQELSKEKVSSIHISMEENTEVYGLDVDMKHFDHSMQGIIQTSEKIQSALKIVSNLLVDSGRVRKDLYHRYHQDHQFRGYKNVKDPKGLVRILSQDTEV